MGIGQTKYISQIWLRPMIMHPLEFFFFFSRNSCVFPMMAQEVGRWTWKLSLLTVD